MSKELTVSEAGRKGGGVRSAAKTGHNPAVAYRLSVATEAARAANWKPLSEIACCGRDPHLKSCPRWKAILRRKNSSK